MLIKNVDEIKEVNLLTVISQYVELEKKGVNYVGFSPFNDEKNPKLYGEPG